MLKPRVATAIATADILRIDGAHVGLHHGNQAETEKEPWGRDGDVVTDTLCLNWIYCQGTRYAFARYVVVIVDEIGELSAQQQLILTKLRHWYQSRLGRCGDSFRFGQAVA